MSKIVHVMMACFYKNGFGYQENILPAKHRQLGYTVEIVTYNQGGDASYNNGIGAPLTYINPDSIPVHVLDVNKSLSSKVPILKLFCSKTSGLYEKLESLSPEIIFIHGIYSIDNLDVIKYCKQHRNVQLFADNHSDYYNAPLTPLKNKILRKTIGRYIGKHIAKMASKVWGVTPWRVAYQQEVYGIPESKSGLLIMGGDECKVQFENRDATRKRIRTDLDIPENAFTIITGGKIDKAKNIHILIDSIRKINRKQIYLIVFGRYESDMIEFSKSLIDSNIRNLGWINANDAYNYFLASDLAVFPGTHSVLWEQACASGIPAIFKDWNGGFNHVDVGGNCLLLDEITAESLSHALLEIVDNNVLYCSLKSIAETKARREFSYIEIAKRSINLNA